MPCPLCGCATPLEKAVTFARGARDGAVVWCPECGCRVARAGVGASRAERQEDAARRCADAWNTRGGVGPGAGRGPEPPGPPMTTDELREAIRAGRAREGDA